MTHYLQAMPSYYGEMPIYEQVDEYLLSLRKIEELVQKFFFQPGTNQIQEQNSVHFAGQQKLH
jgi:hypothetical protein